LKNRKFWKAKKVLISVMLVFTWSMLQFTLVTTATVTKDDHIPNMEVTNTDTSNENHYSNRQVKRMSVTSIEEPLTPVGRVNRKPSIMSDPYGRTRRISTINSNVNGVGRTRRVTVTNFAGFGRARKESVMAAATGTEMKNNTALQKDYIDEIRTRTRKMSVQSHDRRGRGRKISALPDLTENVAINEEAGEPKEQEIQTRKLHGELYQILVSLLMQDGPFLILRLYLIIRLNVSSEMNIFFTCKNAIVSLLLVYRLLILSCRGTDEEDVLDREEAATKLHNIQMAMQMNEFKPLAEITVR